MKRIVTKAFRDSARKNAQQSKFLRFWGESVFNIFVPWPEIPANPNNPEDWKQAYIKTKEEMKQRAEATFREYLMQLNDLGRSGQTDPDIQVSIRESRITGSDE